MIRKLIAPTLMALLATAATAAAEPELSVKQVGQTRHISAVNIDLNRVDDRQVLLARIEREAETVCRNLRPRMMMHKCMAEAVESTVEATSERHRAALRLAQEERMERRLELASR